MLKTKITPLTHCERHSPAALCLSWRWAWCERSCCQGNHCWAHTGCAGASGGRASNTHPTGGRAARSRWGTDAPHTRDLRGRPEGSCPQEEAELWGGGRADDRTSPGGGTGVAINWVLITTKTFLVKSQFFLRGWPWSSGRIRWHTGRRYTPPPTGCHEETVSRRDDTTSRVRWLERIREVEKKKTQVRCQSERLLPAGNPPKLSPGSTFTSSSHISILFCCLHI